MCVNVTSNEGRLILRKLDDSASICCSIYFHPDLTWKAYVYGKELNVIAGTPVVLSTVGAIRSLVFSLNRVSSVRVTGMASTYSSIYGIPYTFTYVYMYTLVQKEATWHGGMMWVVYGFSEGLWTLKTCLLSFVMFEAWTDSIVTHKSTSIQRITLASSSSVSSVNMHQWKSLVIVLTSVALKPSVMSEIPHMFLHCTINVCPFCTINVRPFSHMLQTTPIYCFYIASLQMHLLNFLPPRQSPTNNFMRLSRGDFSIFVMTLQHTYLTA